MPPQRTSAFNHPLTSPLLDPPPKHQSPHAPPHRSAVPLLLRDRLNAPTRSAARSPAPRFGPPPPHLGFGGKILLEFCNRPIRIKSQSGYPHPPPVMEIPASTMPLPPRTNPGLLALIRGKQERTWRPSIAELKRGFRGWHQRGYLPHFDAPGVTQFVTFHLHDSFPVTCHAEWQAILHEPLPSVKRRQLEAWLDRGHGHCWLSQPNVAALVESILLAGDGRQYRLLAWVIMPNHLHLVVEVWDQPLGRMISGWKGQAARRANALLGRSGQFWQDDYYDTLIRDFSHQQRAIHYTEHNPLKASLTRHTRHWRWSSAWRRDHYERLPGAPASERAIHATTNPLSTTPAHPP